MPFSCFFSDITSRVTNEIIPTCLLDIGPALLRKNENCSDSIETKAFLEGIRSLY